MQKVHHFELKEQIGNVFQHGENTSASNAL